MSSFEKAIERVPSNGAPFGDYSNEVELIPECTMPSRDQLIHSAEQTIERVRTDCVSIEDYTGEGELLMCGKCHTPIEKIYSLPARDGMAEEVRKSYCLCSCRQAEIQAEKEAENQRSHFAMVKYLREEGIRDPIYRRYTFGNDDLKNPQITVGCKKYVENWDEMREKNCGILFYGSVGTGKTFYAACIANALIDKQVSVCITSFPRILNTLQEFGRSNTIFADIRRYSLLIIDDLGAERDTSYSLEQVFAVIDERMKTEKPLIVTTNLSLEELKKPMRTDLERIYDRVLEMCSIPIRMTGKSRRAEKAIERMEQAKRIMGPKSRFATTVTYKREAAIGEVEHQYCLGGTDNRGVDKARVKERDGCDG